MTDKDSIFELFRFEVERAAGALLKKGFRRANELDGQSQTTASVFYVGHNVGFEFVLDVRDQAVELMVLRCIDGRLVPAEEGGYRSTLFSHLLDHCGFRGRIVQQDPATPGSSAMQLRIRAALNLLAQPCAALLQEDSPNSLP